MIIIDMTKRILTESEQDNLLDFIKPNPYIPKDSAIAIIQLEIAMFKDQLNGIEISDEILPELKEELRRMYAMSKISAGKMVGIIAGQSLGEKFTQAMLNNFHSAGMGGKTTGGMSRVRQIMDATKKQPITNYTIHLKNPPEDINTLYKIVGSKLVGVQLGDLIESWEIRPDIQPGEHEEPWYCMYEKLYNNHFRECDASICITLKNLELVKHKLSLSEIVESIHTQYIDLTCVFSPPNFNRIDIFVKKDSFEEPDTRVQYISKENYSSMCLEEALLPVIKSCEISGISGIESIHPVKRDNKWYFESCGDNTKKTKKKVNTYKQILGMVDIIDSTRTISNNMWDMYWAFGIEVAREFIISDLMKMMEGINYCHIATIVDKMTFTGIPRSISRFTMTNDDNGWLSKASFEEAITHFIKAATRGEVDECNSVSSRIMIGKRTNIGTGICQLKQNFDMMSKIFTDEKDEKDGSDSDDDISDSDTSDTDSLLGLRT